METKSKDTIGNAYYAKKLYFIPKKERKAVIITSDFHLERTRFVFQKIFGKGYKLKFVSASSFLKNKEKTKVMERDKEILQRTKRVLAEVRPGDHNFLKGKLYKLKFYKDIQKEKRTEWWIKKFIAEAE